LNGNLALRRLTMFLFLVGQAQFGNGEDIGFEALPNQSS